MPLCLAFFCPSEGLTCRHGCGKNKRDIFQRNVRRREGKRGDIVNDTKAGDQRGGMHVTRKRKRERERERSMKMKKKKRKEDLKGRRAQSPGGCYRLSTFLVHTHTHTHTHTHLSIPRLPQRGAHRVYAATCHTQRVGRTAALLPIVPDRGDTK